MIEYPQLTELQSFYINQKVREFLHEDIPYGDKTTDALQFLDRKITAFVQAEEEIILSGSVTMPFFFDDCRVEIFNKDGSMVQTGEIIAIIEGNASSILRKERAFLNILQRMSGIATMTGRFASIAKPYGVKILDTRKTTPGLRLFEKYSVCMGGGFNHRLDLSTGILIKDNHIRSAGSIAYAVEKIKEMKYDLPIELEVDNEEQIDEGLKCGVAGFLLDNMDRSRTLSAVRKIREYVGGDDIFIESSGGITIKNLNDYVDTGINGISIGALTHSIKSAEIHMEFE
jgi:nicotinate-nucleotide pyrophosphorylase (carboxylating)